MSLELGQPVVVSHFLTRTDQGSPYGWNRNWERVEYRGPQRGLYIGWRTLSNGRVSYDPGEGPEYHPQDHFRAYLVVFDSRRNPLYVLPEDCDAMQHGGEEDTCGD